jgi:hypothetical protein
MPTTADPLRIRSVLGHKQWSVPTEFGPDGWYLIRHDYTAAVIVTAAEHDGIEYIHASIATADGKTMPTYEDLVLLYRAVFGTAGYAYQVFAPASEHVNIHPTALHLWGRADGRPCLPEFGSMGTI